MITWLIRRCVTSILFYFLMISLIYLRERERVRESEQRGEGEGEADSPLSRTPDAWLNPIP